MIVQHGFSIWEIGLWGVETRVGFFKYFLECLCVLSVILSNFNVSLLSVLVVDVYKQTYTRTHCSSANQSGGLVLIKQLCNILPIYIVGSNQDLFSGQDAYRPLSVWLYTNGFYTEFSRQLGCNTAVCRQPTAWACVTFGFIQLQVCSMFLSYTCKALYIPCFVLKQWVGHA